MPVRHRECRALLGVLLLTAAQAAPAAIACNLGAASLSFGAYDVSSYAPTDMTGTLEMTCLRILSGSSLTVTLTLSGGQSGNPYARQLRAGGNDRLNYQIYRDAARTLPWGSTAGADAATVTVSLTQIIQLRTYSLNLYGRLPPRQDVAPGSYSDQLVVTLTP
ncbi:Csu type fimbrial protein [Ideonella livida]|uniref:Spore coat protein U domain-containing protein n=1 Tax=Ideonella livida TaxID=2707176 RepID=A0A7C9TLL5_9BURK|nr:spore coat U domain-containing protein [Ideonella livida]NDY92125.1 spore coat protein U domain-containing protein [Ideonella livida]